MTGLRNAYAAIAAVNCEPEKKFAAALIASACEAARAGDQDAYAWIESPAVLRWLPAVTDDCERVRAALLSSIPAPACSPDLCDVAHFLPSVAATFYQSLLPGLETPHAK